MASSPPLIWAQTHRSKPNRRSGAARPEARALVGPLSSLPLQASLGLERIRRLMEERGIGFWEAKETIAAGSVFTTHTVVPAAVLIVLPTLVYLRGVCEIHLALAASDASSEAP